MEASAARKKESSITHLCRKIKEREQRAPLTFPEFTDLLGKSPRLVFRNIFQMFYDMMHSYVGEGVNEYPDDPESIDFVYYDTSRLFVEGTDHPFFADRLFANRLISHVNTFRRGIRQNRIYILEGPHGCGKSTFLNNLLMKFEQYSRTEEGAAYEIVWRLNRKDLGWGGAPDASHIMSQLRGLVEKSSVGELPEVEENIFAQAGKEYLEVPCPSHDNPFLLIPKAYRRSFFDELITDEHFKRKLFKEKQYEWVFKDNPCTICLSLYQTLLDALDSPSKVYDMVFARRYLFDRRLGEGISVFNPGDRISKIHVLTNQLLQSQLNTLLRDSNRVPYMYSRYAKTNNGIYALMDIKSNNTERFANLHGIISEGVHKVEDIEEDVNSLFLALMNPEDKQNISDTQSFSDRITNIKIPYVLDYNTEVKIYRNIFGDHIQRYFLPRVLDNLAKVIISSRLSPRSAGMEEWIPDPDKYRLYCDSHLLLLKMDIYTGLIPSWLSDEDRKNFTAKRRRTIIAESETEGDRGFTGRDSVKIFSEFYSAYAKKDKIITMAMVCGFFNKFRNGSAGLIPEGFLDSLVCQYNYTVLQEVKEALYYYNEDNISREIQNYLFAVSFECGRTEKCVFTGEEIEITEGFFDAVERRILGADSTVIQRMNFRQEVQNQYASSTLTQEMMVDGKKICETQLYESLYNRYIHNLKENVLDPFLKNDNFRNAIKDYHKEGFKSYDKRIREDVTQLMGNLNTKYGYTEQGAKEVCIYVIDNGLANAFSKR
ncbi:MAG: serine protein kinase PrkA [Syntrophobacteraceae bacterium]